MGEDVRRWKFVPELNTVDQRANNKLLRVACWLLFAVAALIVLAIRIRLLAIPLERDEGEYAYAGQLMLQGIPPYQLVYNMKFPGTYAAYAVIMSIFGQTTVGIHLGLLIVNAATVILIFFLGRRLTNEIGAIVAAASYAVLSVSPTVLGLAGHATHFVVLFAVAGALLLLSALDRQSARRLFTSGILFGLGVVMKQPGVLFVGFALAYLLYHEWKIRRGLRNFAIRAAALSVGAALPLVLTCAALSCAGVFDKFYFWTAQYAREYGTRISPSLGAKVFAYAAGQMVDSNWAAWLVASLGLLAACWKKKSAATTVFLILFFFFSILAVCPGLYFRPHYFILALPAVALLMGVAAAQAENLRSQTISVLGITAALALSFYVERDFFFRLSPEAAVRNLHGNNPFPEAVRIAQFLRERSGAGDTIAIMGSEPEIYFYARRHSATGYIYTYPLMEPQRYSARMQREMIKEIEAANPKFLLYVAIDTSWNERPESERMVLDWFAEYSKRNLRPAGLVNIVSMEQTDYYLPYGAESVTPSRYRIEIFERKS